MQVAGFEKAEASIPALQTKLNKINHQITTTSMVSVKTMDQLNTLRKLKKQSDELQLRLSTTANLDDEMEYYSATNDVLGEYYQFDGQKKNSISIEEFYHKTTNNEEKNQKVLLDKYL